MSTENKIFDFDGDTIKNYINYDMGLLSKIGDSFDYIYNKMETLDHYLDATGKDNNDLNKINWDKGKNYDWCAILSGNVKLVLRKYGSHFTIYTKLTKPREYQGRKYENYKYSAFMFHTDRDKIHGDDCELYYDEPCYDLNTKFNDLIKHLLDDKSYFLSNSASFKIPKYCKVDMIFVGESIYSVDKLIFCAEELSSTHTALFAENEMLEKLEEITDRIGEKFDHQYTIKEVRTEFPKQYSDPYYHGVGLNLEKEDGKTDFQDVYSLTMYYYESIFKTEK